MQTDNLKEISFFALEFCPRKNQFKYSLHWVPMQDFFPGVGVEFILSFGRSISNVENFGLGNPRQHSAKTNMHRPEIAQKQLTFSQTCLRGNWLCTCFNAHDITTLPYADIII